MIKHIRIKFLVPILLLQFIALAILGYIGYRFSSDMLRNAAEEKFSKRINTAFEIIERTLDQRVSKIEALIRNPAFIKYNAAPHYKSDVDVEIFNFQKGNGLLLGDPEIGGLVNYPIGLLANEGGRGILDKGFFPSEEYVGRDGIVKQHVYVGGSNDVDFEAQDRKKLDRSETDWFKRAMQGNTHIGSPRKMMLYLKEYQPITISTKEVAKEEILMPIAMPHWIGRRIAGVMMVATTPEFIFDALPSDDLKYLLLIVDAKGEKIAEAGDVSIEKEIPKDSGDEITSEPEGAILDEGELLTMRRALPKSGWSIAMYGRKSDIYGSIHRLKNNIFLIMIASLGVMGLIVFLVIRRLLQPIIRLTNASDKIASGELGVVIEKSADDEIGRLTDSFNKMSVSTKMMHDRISRINFVRRQLLQIISHELRTPLNGIIGFYDLMKGEFESGGELGDSGELKECFEGLGNSIEKYKRLVDRLTKTTSVMSGEMRAGGEIDKEAANLAEAVAPPIAEARRHTKNLITNADLEDVQNIRVACPSNAIRLMLDEALSNAIKYSPENSPIEVMIHCDDAYAKIRVEDKGQGIPKEYIDEVIEPFFEVKDSRLHFTDRYRSGGGGLGLGLTIIGSILRRYQGSFRIESAEGNGTALIMSLPLSADMRRR